MTGTNAPRRTGRRFVRAGTACAGAAIAFAACGSSGPSTSKTYAGHTITIGAVFSLTGIGAANGPQQVRGAQLAVDALNAAGGVKSAKLVLKVEDDQSDPHASGLATTQLISSGALALLGPTLTNSVTSAHPVAAGAHVPMLAVSTTALNIVGAGCSYCAGWIFRDSLGEATAVPADVQAYVARGGGRTAVVLYSNDDKFSNDDARIFTSAAAGAGIDVVKSVPFPKASPDPTPYVSQALSAHPEVIFIASVGTVVGKVMIDARQQGFKGQFLGGNAFNAPAVSQAAGSAGAGAQSAAAWYLGSKEGTNVQFVDAYRARYHADPDQFAAQAYAGVDILAHAAGHAHLTFINVATDRTRIRVALERTDIETPLGRFRFTGDHDVRQTVYIVAMDGRGGFELRASNSG